jgi:hypothetical protein
MPAISALQKPRGSLSELIEHDLKIESRAAYNLENFGGGSLLLPRLIQFASKPCGVCALAGTRGSAAACFAACFGAPSHLPPPGVGAASIRLQCDNYSRELWPTEWVFWFRENSKKPSSA